MRITSAVSAVALSIVLSACSTSQESATDPSTSQESSTDPLSGLYKVTARTNSVKATDLYLNGALIRLEGCSSISCTVSGGYQVRLTLPVDVLLQFGHETEAEIGGVEIVIADSAEDWRLFGGWMTHSAFFVHRSVGLRTNDELVFASSLGRVHLEDSAVLPIEGSASYLGAMVGINLITSDPYMGKSTMTASFGETPTIDIHFTSIMNLRTGDAHGDISFVDASISERKGIWAAPADGGYVNGEIVGPANEEVVGVFGKGELVGAFGAKRAE